MSKVTVTIEFPSEQIRDEFIGWMSNEGEQTFGDVLSEYVDDYHGSGVSFSYKNDNEIVITEIEE